jgi:hypothetical protein
MGKEVWSLKVRERFGIAFIACWSLVLGGCFENDYQRRLDTANDYFRHQEFLDGNLGPTWYGTGLSFRLPKLFEFLAPPEPVAVGEGAVGEGAVKEAGEPEKRPAGQIDRRQPDYLELELAGLSGAWRASTTVDGKAASAYAYLMTNQVLPAGSNPAEFTNKLIEDLVSAAKLTVNPESWENVSFPKQSSFVTPVAYQTTDQESAREVGGNRMRYKIYRHQAGDLQIVILFVIPVKSADPLLDMLPYSLETLTVQASSGTVSSPGSPGAPTAGGL